MVRDFVYRPNAESSGLARSERTVRTVANRVQNWWARFGKSAKCNCNLANRIQCLLYSGPSSVGCFLSSWVWVFARALSLPPCCLSLSLSLFLFLSLSSVLVLAAAHIFAFLAGLRCCSLLAVLLLGPAPRQCLFLEPSSWSPVRASPSPVAPSSPVISVRHVGPMLCTAPIS